MDWKEKIALGMKLIAEGCHDTEEESMDSSPCYNGCPFSPYCDGLSYIVGRRGLPSLDEWDK